MTQESQTFVCQFVEDVHKTEISKTRLIKKKKKKGQGGGKQTNTIMNRNVQALVLFCFCFIKYWINFKNIVRGYFEQLYVHKFVDKLNRKTKSENV